MWLPSDKPFFSSDDPNFWPRRSMAVLARPVFRPHMCTVRFLKVTTPLRSPVQYDASILQASMASEQLVRSNKFCPFSTLNLPLNLFPLLVVFNVSVQANFKHTRFLQLHFPFCLSRILLQVSPNGQSTLPLLTSPNLTLAPHNFQIIKVSETNRCKIHPPPTLDIRRRRPTNQHASSRNPLHRYRQGT